MRVKVTQKQFELLLNNFHLIGDRGLELTMSGKLAKMLTPETYIVNEQKLFKVDIWIGAYPTKVIIYSDNSASARVVAGKLYPKAKIFSASELRGRL
jgi:hypothetical protein